MIQTAERGAKARRSANDASATSDGLPYVIELWNRTGTKPQCVIARAQNAALARAIFKAAAAENPERKLTLRRNERALASTE
jgi:predicted ATP-grasp superfamily ATP-dependent carboligase